MSQTVLEYLESSALKYPDKNVFEDGKHAFTYTEVLDMSRRIGSAIAASVKGSRLPCAVFMDKNIESVVSFMGILYSGNFYCPIDSKMPEDRINTILSVLQPKVIITDNDHLEQAENFECESTILLWENIIQTDIDEQALKSIRNNATERDPLYVLFTSGSTGVPKGVLVSHRVITNYLEWLDDTFNIDNSVVFGNQAPLYFDISMHDVYGTLYFGGTLVIIPQHLFSFPVKLIEFMNERKISSILWVPSAMGILAILKAFKAIKPEYLKEVMFAGEVLPRKHLDYWRTNLPDAVYANLYGPTETFVCTAYICNGNEPDGEPMPIGSSINNSGILILDENNNQVSEGDVGELCLRGSCLAMGYYNNPERTAQSFVQNPLQNQYPDLIYHTGDLVYMNKEGNLIYVSRKDFQIKHMGYRIELGEIETAASNIDGIEDCACTYDTRSKRIILHYTGTEMDKSDLSEMLSDKIPAYMIPQVYKYMRSLPHNANGKIDRKALS